MLPFPSEISTMFVWCFVAYSAVVALCLLSAPILAIKFWSIPHKRKKLAVVGSTVSAIWLIGALVFALYTGIGIIAFHGSDYWIHKAESAQSEDLARTYIDAVVNSSNYGAFAAEGAIRRLGEPEARARLFRYLAQADTVMADSHRQNFLRQAYENERLAQK